MYNLKQGKSSFEPIPDSRYTLKIDGVKVEPHTKDGKEGHRFEVTFTVTSGEFKGRKVWDNIYLPWVAWKMYTLLEAGGSTEINNETATPETICGALTGLEVSAYLSTTMGNNDKPRTNVSEYKNKNVAADVADDDGMDFSRLQ